MEYESIQRHERRLLVFETVKSSFVYMWRERQSLLAPLAMLVLFQLLTYRLQFWALVSGFPRLQALVFIPVWVMQLALMVGLQRRLHRDGRESGLRLFAFDPTVFRSVLTAVKVLLCIAFVPGVVTIVGVLIVVVVLHLRHIVLITTVLTLAGMFISLALLMRLVLAVPAAALGESKCLSLSWRAMRGHSVRLFMAGVLINVPFVAFVTLLTWKQLTTMARFSTGRPPTFLPIADTYWLSWLGSSVLASTGAMAGIVMLCMAYGRLVGGQDARDAQGLLEA